jgi:hypothetical protein
VKCAVNLDFCSLGKEQYQILWNRVLVNTTNVHFCNENGTWGNMTPKKENKCYRRDRLAAVSPHTSLDISSQPVGDCPNRIVIIVKGYVAFHS